MFNADVRATSKVREFLFAFGDTVSGQQAISFLLARFYRFAADFECLLGVELLPLLRPKFGQLQIFAKFKLFAMVGSSILVKYAIN